MQSIVELRTKCKWQNCENDFANDVECFEHVRVAHIAATNAVVCRWDDCGSRTSTKWNLVTHMNRHLFVVRGYCHLCNRTFKWSGDAKRHSRKHTNEEEAFNKIVDILFK